MLIKVKLKFENNYLNESSNNQSSFYFKNFSLLFVFALIIFSIKQSSAAPFLDKNHNANPIIKCYNPNQAVFKHQSYCLNECVTKSLLKQNDDNSSIKKQVKSARAQNFSQFEEFCFLISSHSNNYNQHIQSYFKSEIKEFNLNPLINSDEQNQYLNENDYLNVFIFDFRSVSGEIYIDFKQIDENFLRESSNLVNLKTYLIINLVSNQFVTYRLLNLPDKSQYLDNLFILLNGESSLDIIQSNKPNEQKLTIQVFNSPYYLLTENFEWFHYLKQRFNLDFDRKNYFYIEHLSLFCHTFHVRVNLANMILINSQNNLTLNQKIDFVQYMEWIDLDYELNLIQECEVIENNDNENFKTIVENNKKYDDEENLMSLRINTLEINHQKNQNPIYLFEIDNVQKLLVNNDENFLRAYVKECDLNTNYIIIFYMRINGLPNHLVKKLIFDESKCNFEIYSNIDVYDLLDQKIHVNKLENYQELFNFSNETDISKKIVARNLNTKNFYYLKINAKANEIEMWFLTPNQETLIHNSFLNKIKQHIFVSKDPEAYSVKNEDDNSSTNQIIHKDYSIKFVLSESDIMDFFKAHYINLQHWISNYDNATFNASSEQNFFFVTEKSCKALYLYKELVYSSNSYLILFNSKFYDNVLKNDQVSDSKDLHVKLNDCFYLDKFTNTFYLTFGFSTDYENYIQTVYFNINNLHIETQKPLNPDSLKTQSHKNHQLAAARESHINAYFRTIVENSLSSQCNVDSMTSYNEETKAINLNAIIKIKMLDDLISWRLSNCWFSENECLSNLLDLSNQQIIESDSEESRERSEDFNDNLSEALDSDEMYPNKDENKVLNIDQNINYDYFQMTTDIDALSTKKTSKKPLVVRSISRLMANNENSMKLKINNYKTNFKYEMNKKFYDFYMNFSIKLTNLEKHLKNKTYLVCNIRPDASCNQVYYRNESLNISFSNKVENEPLYFREPSKKCDSNSKWSNERNQMPLRTIFLAIINPVEFISNEKNIIKNFSFSFSNQTKNDNICTDIIGQNEKIKDLNNTTSSSYIKIDKTKIDHKTESDSKQFFYNNRLTIMLLIILCIFLVFCFLIMKKVSKIHVCCLNSNNQKKTTKRQDNSQSNTIGNGHEEQQLNLLNVKVSNDIRNETLMETNHLNSNE